MPTTDPGTEDVDPLVVHESAADTDGEFVRFELTLYPRGSSIERDADLAHDPWSIDVPTEHVHPLQEEHWSVRSGGLGVEYGGTEKLLTDGDSIELPTGVPHRIWNPIDEPSRVVLEFHPALDAQALTETLYVLAQRGETNENGHLKLLQFAVTQADYPDQLYLTAVPVRVQKFLIRVLAPIGRRVGYRGTHPLDSLETED